MEEGGYKGYRQDRRKLLASCSSLSSTHFILGTKSNHMSAKEKPASKNENIFKGLSMLRAQERKAAEAPKVVDKALQDYLNSKYMEEGVAQNSEYAEPKRKKKKAKKADAALKIVEVDLSGFVQAKGATAIPNFPSDEDEDDCEHTTLLRCTMKSVCVSA